MVRQTKRIVDHLEIKEKTDRVEYFPRVSGCGVGGGGGGGGLGVCSDEPLHSLQRSGPQNDTAYDPLAKDFHCRYLYFLSPVCIFSGFTLETRTTKRERVTTTNLRPCSDG